MLKPPKNRGNIVTLGVQAAVWDGAGRVLLVRHGYRPGWHFPGGGVERDEVLRESLIREVEEETGVVLEEAPALFAIYSHFDSYPGDHIVLFTASRWRRARTPLPGREIAESGFFSLDELPEGTTLPTRRRLREIVAGIRPSETW